MKPIIDYCLLVVGISPNMRCSFRNRNNPNNHNRNNGFRVCLSTLFRSLPKWPGGVSTTILLGCGRLWVTAQAREKWRGLFLAASFCLLFVGSKGRAYNNGAGPWGLSLVQYT